MAVIFLESFETDGNGTRYSTSTPEFSDGGSDFFTRTDGSGISTAYEVTGADGAFYFAAQDLDGEGALSTQTLTISSVNISGFENLRFSADFAEDDSSDGNEDCDVSDFARVDYQIDGGGYKPLLAFENDGTTFNTAPSLDTDFDGNGDGTLLTAVFATFNSTIVGAGTLLDLRFTFALDSGDEDLAVDNILLEGDAMSTEQLVLQEGFETDGNGTRYTTSVSEFTDGGSDFFTRSDGTGISGTYDVSGQEGDFYFAAQDIDGEGAASQQTLDFTGLDISGLTDLTLSALVAEDDASDGSEDWDATDFLAIEYQIDGGGYQPLLAVENDGSTFNSVPSVDTDFDGNGDGAVLTDAFQSLSAKISGTGARLDLRLTFDLDSGDEDIAIDDIKIVGQSGGTVTPAVLAVSGDGLNISEKGMTTDSFALQLSTEPMDMVTVSVTADAQSEISLDGVAFASTIDVVLGDSATQTNVIVRAIDDSLDEADPHTSEVTFSVSSGDLDYDGLTISPLTVNVADDDVTITKIHVVQGSGSGSDLEGLEVTVEGIVTGLFYSSSGAVLGFYLQEEDADADGDTATSEGVFVFSSDAAVAVGDKAQVTGIVDEEFGRTEIEAAATNVISSGNALPTAVAIMLGMGPDFEAVEGMRVELLSASEADPLTVVTNFNLDRFGEIQVAEGNLVQPTQVFDPETQQAEIQSLAQANQDGRLIIDDSASGSNPIVYRLLEGPDGGPVSPINFDPTAPQLRLGTELENVAGVMDFAFGAYRLQANGPLQTIDANPRPDEAPEVGGDLKVASFNVLNFFTTLDDGSSQTGPDGDLDPRGATTQFDLDRQTEKLVNALVAIDADIIGLQELENNGYAHASAIATLVESLNAATAPGTYAFVEPGNSNGGFVGTDAITTGLIYKPGSVALVGNAQALVFDEASAATTFALAETLNSFASSDDQVGDFQRNRPAIAATFEDVEGNEITVVSNHFKSKGDSNLEDLVNDATNAGAPQDLLDALIADANYDQGDGQGFWNQVRADASAELAEWLATNPTGATDTSNILILGDLNAYAKENPVTTLEDAGYTDLAEAFIGDDAYSFVFDGQRGTLDYGLSSAAILDNITGVAEWHIAADEPDFMSYASEFLDPVYYNGADVFAASDHDPLIIGLDLTESPEIAVARLDFEERFFRDKLVYSLDGEVIGSQRLKTFSRDIDVQGSGITIDSDDGIRWSPSFITTLGDGLGVRSIRGDKFLGPESRLLDDAETLSFALEKVNGLGDALEVEFEFAKVRGAGQVSLTFFDDAELVDSVLLSIEDASAGYKLAEGDSFDTVEIGTTEHLGVSLEAVEFVRILSEEDTLA